MPTYFPAPIRTQAPPGACPPCNGVLRAPCPSPGWIQGNCGNCRQQVLLAIRYLGQLRCWTPADRTCNPNFCCPIIDFDPWAGLRAGLWLSSTVVPVYVDCPEGGAQEIAMFSNFNGRAVTLFPTTGTSAICGTTQVATLTVFDDGTYTLA